MRIVDDEMKTFKSFVWKEMLVSNGLTNGVINGVIFFFITSGAASRNGYLVSTLITNVILGLILINLYPVLIRSKLRKNPDIRIPYTKESHIVAALYPNGKWVIRTVNIIVCVLITTIFTMGLVGCLCLSEVSVMTGAILRGLDCALFSVIAYYFCIVFTGTAQASQE